MPYTVRFASTAEDRELAYGLRRDVFETEQNVPRPLDRDVHDHNANHVVAIDEAGRCVGTGRLVRVDSRTGQIGRMAVASTHRRLGVGEQVIHMLEELASMRGIGDLICHAQLPAVPFFRHRGYAQEGGEFLAEGVPHVVMRKTLVHG
ncbi:MAG: GNAT family N-acetyltransferase [Anaeromyxobacter sp.]|nr:GNAT family N-acetyltransferase [Anaeromyxobacter sp.]MBL0274633.1 GNAT family N-acetyltransferase [Anaeromyxobacter sp.]